MTSLLSSLNSEGINQEIILEVRERERAALP